MCTAISDDIFVPSHADASQANELFVRFQVKKFAFPTVELDDDDMRAWCVQCSERVQILPQATLHRTSRTSVQV